MRIEREDLSSGTPVSTTLAEVKAHLRMTHSEQDDYINALILAAEDHISDITGVQLRRHRLRFFFESTIVFNCPFLPAFTVEKVGYYPTDGTAFVTLTEGTDYTVLHYGNKIQILFTSVPTVYFEGVRADILCGYTAALNNEKVAQAVKLLVSHMFHNNIPATETQQFKVPYGLAAFIASLRATQITEVTDASSS